MSLTNSFSSRFYPLLSFFFFPLPPPLYQSRHESIIGRTIYYATIFFPKSNPRYEAEESRGVALRFRNDDDIFSYSFVETKVIYRDTRNRAESFSVSRVNQLGKLSCSKQEYTGLPVTNVARFRFPFGRCSDTVKSPLPVAFRASLIFLASRSERSSKRDPLPPLLCSLLFTLRPFPL